MPKRWLVTGGCGFIGVNLVKALKQRGDGVRVLDNFSVGSRDDLQAVTEFTESSAPTGFAPAQVELMAGDIRDRATCQQAVRGVEAVVHLAAQTGVIPSQKDPRFDCEQNVLGTLNLLQAAREAGLKKFIFASSSAPLGEQQPPIHEEKVPKPLAPYGASKLAGEAYCSAFHASFALDTVALRFSNAYGPYSFKKGSVVALFFRRALADQPLILYGDGRQTRDFLHVQDLCQAIIQAAEAAAGGEVFQIATGRETKVVELAHRVKSLVERDTSRQVKIGREPARPGEIYRNFSDISKAREKLGYQPRIGLPEGLEDTWNWFKSQKQGRPEQRN